jgi:DNA polymerase-3 subunit beta
MKLVCEREKLAGAFALTAAVVSTRSPKPILQNVKMEVAEDHMILMATDLETGIRMEVPLGEVSEPGEAILPTRRVRMILQESHDEKIEIESSQGRTILRGQHSQFQLPTQSSEEFPVVYPFDATEYFEMPARIFRELIRRTAFATDAEDNRYALSGVMFEMEGDTLFAVGTDGRRLACQQASIQSTGSSLEAASAILPTKALNLLERSLADPEGNVLIDIQENRCILQSRKTTFVTRLVEGRFPRWRDVLPDTTQMKSVEFVVGSLLASVRQAAIVTSEERRGVLFRFGEGNLELMAHGAEDGESRVEMPIAFEGESAEVKMDPRYVIDFLKNLDQESSISVFFKDAFTPVLCQTNENYSYVIMPLTNE